MWRARPDLCCGPCCATLPWCGALCWPRMAAEHPVGPTSLHLRYPLRFAPRPHCLPPQLLCTAMDPADWTHLRTDFSYRFALDNAPNGISERLLKVTDMEVRGWVGGYSSAGWGG